MFLVNIRNIFNNKIKIKYKLENIKIFNGKIYVSNKVIIKLYNIYYVLNQFK